MAYILSDIITKVQQRVRDTGYSTAEITNYLNDTINDVFNEYRLPFMRSSQTYTVTAGNSDITDGDGLPANYVTAINLMDTTSGQEVEVPIITESDLDEIYPDKADTALYPNGQPLYAYYDGSTIRVFPAPADAYTFRLRYEIKPTTLTNPSDVPVIPSQFEELLVVGASYRVMQVKDNYDQAGILENKYQELLQKLVVKTSSTQTGSPRIMRLNRSGQGGYYPYTYFKGNR